MTHLDDVTLQFGDQESADLGEGIATIKPDVALLHQRSTPSSEIQEEHIKEWTNDDRTVFQTSRASGAQEGAMSSSPGLCHSPPSTAAGGSCASKSPATMESEVDEICENEAFDDEVSPSPFLPLLVKADTLACFSFLSKACRRKWCAGKARANQFHVSRTSHRHAWSQGQLYHRPQRK